LSLHLEEGKAGKTSSKLQRHLPDRSWPFRLHRFMGFLRRFLIISNLGEQEVAQPNNIHESHNVGKQCHQEPGVGENHVHERGRPTHAYRNVRKQAEKDQHKRSYHAQQDKDHAISHTWWLGLPNRFLTTSLHMLE